MTATVDCEFTGFVFKSDYYLFDEKDAPFIWDADWNEHYYAVSFMAQVSVRAYLNRIIHESETRSWDSLVTSYNRTCHRM
jgi:hypothetical protein